MAKKKAKKSVLHKEVHPNWGYVTLAVAALIIFGVAGWFYLTM